MIKIDTIIVGEMKYLKFHMEAHVNQQFHLACVAGGIRGHETIPVNSK
jgi:hypothetical protein